MDILIIGGDSLIAKNYIDFCIDKGLDFVCTSRRDSQKNKAIFFDLKNPDFEFFKKKQFNFVVFFASIANIEFCENNRDESYLINVINTKKSLDAFSKISKKILYISSNCVFDGKKPFMKVDDITNPMNEYGKQKLEVENWIKSNLHNTSILRASKIIHPQFNLINEWKNKLDKEKEIYPYINKFLAPTPIKNVIEKIEFIRRINENLLHHCKSNKDLSYYEFALDIFENHINKKLIQKGASDDKMSSVMQFSSLK